MKMPQKVTDLDVDFGTGEIEQLLPSMSEIPAEFTSLRSNWCDFINDFFYGVLLDVRLNPRKGIDRRQALRHIQAILVSFEPEHNHKIAGCAYLMSLWFENDYSYILYAHARGRE